MTTLATRGGGWGRKKGRGGECGIGREEVEIRGETIIVEEDGVRRRRGKGKEEEEKKNNGNGRRRRGGRKRLNRDIY